MKTINPPSRAQKAAVLALALLSHPASAAVSTLVGAVCNLYFQVVKIAAPLAFVVFAYGGVQWVYSADDPGGRKKARGIMITAIVGLLIVLIAKDLVTALTNETPCT